MKALIAILLLAGIPFAYADVEISVYQNLTPDEQYFIQVLEAGYRDVTYTVGVGVQHIVDGEWIKFVLPPANAETYNDSVSFPIPDNIADIMKRCGIEKMDDTELIIECQWKFTSEQIQEWYEEIAKNSIVPPTVDTPEEQVVAPAPIESAPEYKPTPYERDLAYFTENPPHTESNKEYFALLKHLGECQRGYEQSKGIQDNERYGS